MRRRSSTDDLFAETEALLYEYKTYALAIKNLSEEIEYYRMPTCISNYSDDPVSYTVGNTSDSTYKHAVARAESKELQELKTRLKEKLINKKRIEEIVLLFNQDENILWTERYLEDKEVAVIYDTHNWSKSTYNRIRRRLILKTLKCLGKI